MHPSARFHIEDREEMAALVRAAGFGALVAQTEAGLRAVHVPVMLRDERLRFHVSRSNLVYRALGEGAEALFVANGPHAYISPHWYGTGGRVPTWSYVAVELNGPVRALDDTALLALLEEMSAEHEDRLAPKPSWTKKDVNAERYDALVAAIGGFEMEIREWRGTAKIDQDKPQEVRARIAEALTARGETEMAALYAAGPGK